MNDVDRGLIELIAIVCNKGSKKCDRDAGGIQTSQKKRRFVGKRLNKCGPWADRRYFLSDMGEDVLS
jgi:hypothetical protein